MKPLNILILACTFLLTACGGGSSTPTPPTQTDNPPTSQIVVSLYGDSLTAGDVAIKGFLDVPPTQRLQEILGNAYRVELRGTSGAVAKQALLGDLPR